MGVKSRNRIIRSCIARGEFTLTTSRDKIARGGSVFFFGGGRACYCVNPLPCDGVCVILLLIGVR